MPEHHLSEGCLSLKTCNYFLQAWAEQYISIYQKGANWKKKKKGGMDYPPPS